MKPMWSAPAATIRLATFTGGTGEAAGLPKSLVSRAIEEMADTVGDAIAMVEDALPVGFPPYIHKAVKAALSERAHGLKTAVC